MREGMVVYIYSCLNFHLIHNSSEIPMYAAKNYHLSYTFVSVGNCGGYVIFILLFGLFFDFINCNIFYTAVLTICRFVTCSFTYLSLLVESCTAVFSLFLLPPGGCHNNFIVGNLAALLLGGIRSASLSRPLDFDVHYFGNISQQSQGPKVCGETVDIPVKNISSHGYQLDIFTCEMAKFELQIE